MCASVFDWGCSYRDTIRTLAADGSSEEQEDVEKDSYRVGGGNVGRKGSDQRNNNTHRWRLVVLEASWQHGKTMYRQVGLKDIDPLSPRVVAAHFPRLHITQPCTCPPPYCTTQFIRYL